MASKSASFKVSGIWKTTASPPASSTPFLQLLASWERIDDDSNFRRNGDCDNSVVMLVW